MKIFKGSISYRSDGFPTKVFLLLCSIISFTIIGISCNDKNEGDSQPLQASLSSSAEKGQVESKSVSSGLGNLYIENFNDPSRNQLAKLLADENYKKLVFQFYQRKDGRLTLVAFAAKQNGKEFNPYFHVLNWVDDVAVQDIEGKEVFLGDQKLDNDASFKMLKDAINKGSKKDESHNYVVFTPELKRFTADGKYVIEYSIHFTSSLVDFSNQILPVSRGRLNPSPPY
ncbi:hypothetical protein GZH53_06250 [Flavihumibacter sp. R14]|nr:hypothetical protein [Flavihumibacter soli]